jgi:hypothetical protein
MKIRRSGEQETATPPSPIHVFLDRQQEVRHSLDFVDGQAGGPSEKIRGPFLSELENVEVV